MFHILNPVAVTETILLYKWSLSGRACKQEQLAAAAAQVVGKECLIASHSPTTTWAAAADN
jgi:hypothetical protein